MVDSALLGQVRQLALEDKAQLRSILDAELADYVSPEVAILLDARWAEVEANPDDYVTIDEDERELRALPHCATWDVRATPNARRDRHQAVAWLDERHPTQADQFIDDYYGTLRRITHEAGLPAIENCGFRQLAFDIFKYHVWYRVLEGSNVVYVVAIRYQGRDPEELDHLLRTSLLRSTEEVDVVTVDVLDETLER